VDLLPGNSLTYLSICDSSNTVVV